MLCVVVESTRKRVLRCLFLAAASQPIMHCDISVAANLSGMRRAILSAVRSGTRLQAQSWNASRLALRAPRAATKVCAHPHMPQ